MSMSDLICITVAQKRNVGWVSLIFFMTWINVKSMFLISQSTQTIHNMLFREICLQYGVSYYYGIANISWKKLIRSYKAVWRMSNDLNSAKMAYNECIFQVNPIRQLYHANKILMRAHTAVLRVSSGRVSYA